MPHCAGPIVMSFLHTSDTPNSIPVLSLTLYNIDNNILRHFYFAQNVRDTAEKLLTSHAHAWKPVTAMPGPAPQPQVTIAKPAGAGGVLPISAITARTSTQAQVDVPAPSSKAAQATSQQKLKLVIRRLPPGLTLPELQSALGDEWKIGQGRVTWTSWRPGKVSRK